MMYVFSDVLEIYHLKDIAYDLGLYDYKWWVMSLIVTICGQAIMCFQLAKLTILFKLATKHSCHTKIPSFLSGQNCCVKSDQLLSGS